MTSIRSPPISDLSESAVPRAMILPRSTTAMLWASSSASSRYWVVSRIVVPSWDALPDDLPHAEATARIEAGRRLVEEDQPGPADQRARQVEPPPHAARVRLDRAVGRIGQRELLEQVVGAALRLGLRELIQPAEQHQVLAAGQVLVDRRVLPREPDHRSQFLRFPDDVVAGDRRSTRIGPEQGRQDPHRRRLARPVGAEQPEDGALRHGEVEAVERPHLLLPGAVDLDETFGGDCVVSGHDLRSTFSRARSA